MFGVMNISSSALRAQRIRIQVIADNVANAQTLAAGVDRNGNVVPYRRKEVFLVPGAPEFGLPSEGVRVRKIGGDPSPFPKEYDPDHPLAARSGPDAGYVRRPNVDPLAEMTDLLIASRVYEANLTAMETTKGMMRGALRILA